MPELQDFDVVIVGAGAAGMMCAIETGKRSRRVLLLDHAEKVGKKILISGGGRCNFTNMGADASHYFSQNPHFCKSALNRYPPENFIELVRKYDVPFHEKKLGQLFCDRSAKDIVALLTLECEKSGVRIQLKTKIHRVEKTGDGFRIETNQGTFSCFSLVVATGGLSFPKIGATDFGYRIAEQFGLKIVTPSPALDGFVFSEKDRRHFEGLSGISVPARLTANGHSFRENVLFTHAGLSGPAALQGSLYWSPGDAIEIDFSPDNPLNDWFLERKKSGSKMELQNLLAQLFSQRLAERFCKLQGMESKSLQHMTHESLTRFSEALHHWKIFPEKTVGYQKAEVTRGGVDTHELSSKTMEAVKIPGLYFIGEVVDVTGELGGYNFQWAWSSGWACGQTV